MRLTEVITMANNMTNLGSYSGPTFNPAISARHLSVTFLKSGASRNCRTVSSVRRGVMTILRDSGVCQLSWSRIYIPEVSNSRNAAMFQELT